MKTFVLKDREKEALEFNFGDFGALDLDNNPIIIIVV